MMRPGTSKTDQWQAGRIIATLRPALGQLTRTAGKEPL